MRPSRSPAPYAWRGEADQAFEWLDRALAQRDGGLGDLRLDPLLRGLRRDPRFRAMERKIGLPATTEGRPQATTGRRGGLARSPRLTSWAKISIRLTTPGGYSLPSLSTATTGSPRARAQGP